MCPDDALRNNFDLNKQEEFHSELAMQNNVGFACDCRKCFGHAGCSRRISVGRLGRQL
jgi:hypothetical protein